MSVRKGDRGEGKLQVLNKARELKKYTLGLIKSEKHFPKSTRWIYASPIVNEIREARLFALGLQLNDKTALYPLRQGVKLLQWRFIVTDTGAIIRKMGKKKQSKQRRKLKKLYAKERRGEYAPGTAHESLVSWLANAARGDTYHERLKMINYFKNMEATYNAREYL